MESFANFRTCLVKNNRQTAVLLDATADPNLANDPYIMRQQPKSILCSPILHQGKFLGILYLENNLVTGAFTSDRVELLNLLCAQAANGSGSCQGETIV